jgi:predicted RNA binding protein YcfA (HicA-like mRNA interferase family)
VPKFPRNVEQARAIRAFIRAGGTEIPRRGKGSHRVVVMPNGVRLTLQYGIVPVGALAAMVKQADISVDDFISYL